MGLLCLLPLSTVVEVVGLGGAVRLAWMSSFMHGTYCSHITGGRENGCRVSDKVLIKWAALSQMVLKS